MGLGLGFGFYVTNSNRKVRIRGGVRPLEFYVTNSDRSVRVGDRVIFNNQIPVLLAWLALTQNLELNHLILHNVT